MVRNELLKTAKPILFNTEMVRAILDGRKTVTRRCVKPKSRNAYGFFVLTNKSDGSFAGVYDYDDDENAFDKPQKQPAYKGDILYVRETWNKVKLESESDWHYEYRASCENTEFFSNGFMAEWHPSIHMPKEAARIFLRVTDVRVERLQEINADGIRNEGLTSMAVHVGEMEIALAEFALLWDSTVKKSDLDRYGWAANPWVWVIEFERVEVQE